MIIDLFGYRQWAINVAAELADYVDIEARMYLDPGQTSAQTVFAVGWSEMIPESFYRSRDVFVVHPSPLPRYRGGSPIQHQIMNGEEWTRITIFKLTPDHPGIDTGPIAWQSGPIPIGPDLDLEPILESFTYHAAYGIATVVRLIQAGSLELIEQNADDVPTFKRRTPEQSEITLDDFRTMSARQLHNKIRALQDPYPAAFVVCADGRKLYLNYSTLEGQE